MRFLPLGGPSLSPGGGHAQQAAWEVVGILCLVKPQSYGSGSELNLNNNNNKKKNLKELSLIKLSLQWIFFKGQTREERIRVPGD